MSKQPEGLFFVPGEVIRLTERADWLADGIEITHEETRRLFARSIKKDAQGYYIQVGYEAKRIEVEDTAYFVRRIEGYPETGYELFLTDESQQRLDPLTLHYQPGRLTCRLKNGEEARFLHAAYFDLLKNLQEDETTYFVIVGGHRIELGLKP
jgi:hypothetical protein